MPNNPFEAELNSSIFEEVNEQEDKEQGTESEEQTSTSESKTDGEVSTKGEKDDEVSDKQTDESDEQTDDQDSDESDEQDTDEQEPSLFSAIAEQLGVESLEKEYDETQEGVAEFAKDYAQTYYEHMLEKEKEEDPFLAEYRKFRDNGGDVNKFLETYQSVSSIESLEVGEGYDDNNKKIITKHFRDLGHSEEDIEDTIIAFEARDKLAEKAEELKPRLVEKEKKVIEEQQKEQEQVKAQQEKFNKDFNKQVQQSLKTGKIGSYQLPKEDLKGMTNYLMKADEDGATPYQKDVPQTPQDAADLELMMAYIKYKKLQLSDLKKASAKPKAPAKLKLGSREKGGRAATQKQQDILNDLESGFMKK